MDIHQGHGKVAVSFFCAFLYQKYVIYKKQTDIQKFIIYLFSVNYKV